MENLKDDDREPVMNDSERKPYTSPYDKYRFTDPDEPLPEDEEEDDEYDEYDDYGEEEPDCGEASDEEDDLEQYLKTDYTLAGAARNLIKGLASLLLGAAIAVLLWTCLNSLGKRDSSASRGGLKTEAKAGNEESASNGERITLGRAAREKEEAEGEPSAPDLSAAEIVQNVMPAMVAITGSSLSDYREFVSGRRSHESVSIGSGIIVAVNENDVLITTNCSVVSGESAMTIAFFDGSTAEGRLIGASSVFHIAILAVRRRDLEEPVFDAIRVIRTGSSDGLRVGEPVFAVGNALGYGQSVSSGIVSAIGRQLTDESGLERCLLQTDASINPGNSGGALLNRKGELIGINEARVVDRSVEGVGYAIPISDVRSVIEGLVRRAGLQKVPADKAGFLGINCVTVPQDYYRQGYPAGICVTGVLDECPADAAGIRVRDIITAIEDVSVTDHESLLDELSYYAEGQSIRVTVSRMDPENSGFESLDIDVILGMRDAASDAVPAEEAELESQPEWSERLERDYENLFGDDDDTDGFYSSRW